MITEIVTFDLPEGMSREEVLAKYEATLPRWRANPDLIRKTYLYDPAGNRGGGIYLWPSVEAAKAAHDADWCRLAEETYGSAPRFDYFETPLIVENVVEAD
ncbi:monooxygenase [Thalassovita mangrovi]|uniref:Monooxygenase n=1 Tax=Thalassovita mangrovi TaxID=2692236 RepID=A0A6L8LIE7_9RHOB|nr:monooxygenase [Thalassovita mangrovi]MYM55625.1 monooxygenase [Thalassovita mangrovi]